MNLAIRNSAIRLAAVGLGVAAWETASRSGLIDPIILPSPSEAAIAGWQEYATLLRATEASLFRVLMGLLISALGGIGLGLWMGRSSFVSAIFDPIVDVLRPVPGIAWIPVIILWFGIGNLGSIAVIVLGAFFPILLNTIAGIRSVDGAYIDLLRTLGSTEWDVMREVVIPGSLPYIFAGLRISIGIAWGSVVAAEMFGAQSGLGYQIQFDANFLHTSEIIAGMACIGLIGYLLDYAFSRYAAHRWLAWQHPLNDD